MTVKFPDLYLKMIILKRNGQRQLNDLDRSFRVFRCMRKSPKRRLVCFIYLLFSFSFEANRGCYFCFVSVLRLPRISLFSYYFDVI